MPYGYNGKTLRVDLTTQKIKIGEPEETWYRKYLGGMGSIAFHLLKEVPPKTDPFSPENILILAFEELSTKSRILFGHTLSNPDVKNSLRSINIEYANLSYTNDPQIQSKRKKLTLELKVIPPAIIYAIKTGEGERVYKRGLVNKCVKPSELNSWLREHVSNKTN